jgi:hypothetical protein
MNPLAPAPFWQGFAHGIFQAGKGFVWRRAMLHHAKVSHAPATCDLICKYCYPSPFLWPDPYAVRPFFMGRGQSVADGGAPFGFGFSRPAIVVTCASITTQTRGSSPCINPFSSFPLSPRHWPGACRTTAAVRLSVRALARRRQPLPKMTSPQVPPLALLAGPCATTQAFANNLTRPRASHSRPSGPWLGWSFALRGTDV